MKPRVLFVGRTRYTLPLGASLERKFDALAGVLDLRVLAGAADGGAAGDERFRLVRPLRPALLDGPAFYASLPARIARELRDFRPDAVVAQSPYEAAAALAARALARTPTRVVLEVHGDWRTATRLYGSPVRRLLSPLADRVSTFAVRRADAVRAVSEFTAGLVRESGVEPRAVFTTYTDLGAFLERPVQPLPPRPQALFVGVLELYKNVDGLADAWRRAALRVPGATLRIVGKGRRAEIVERLVAELPEQTAWTPALSTPEVVEALDDATVLVLPSRSEGLPRVLLEALCRGRPAIASRAGGNPDLIEDGVNGFLVDPEDVDGLADLLVRTLGDPELVRRMSPAARASVESWLATPEEYAEHVRALVEGAQP